MCAARTHERTLLPDNAYVLPIFCFSEPSRRRPRYCRGILVGFAFFVFPPPTVKRTGTRGVVKAAGTAAVAADGDDGDEDEETFLCLLLLLQMFGLDLGPQCEGECHPIGED